jgi:hypothetical protein
MFLKILRPTPSSHASMRGGAPQSRKIKDTHSSGYQISIQDRRPL